MKTTALEYSAVESYRVVRCWESHIIYTIGLLMAARLSVLRAGRTLPRKDFLRLIYNTGWVNPRAVVRLEGLSKFKISMTSSGFEPATFRLVAECIHTHTHTRAYFTNYFLIHVTVGRKINFTFVFSKRFFKRLNIKSNFTEFLEKFFQTARCHIPKDSNAHSYRHENPESHMNSCTPWYVPWVLERTVNKWIQYTSRSCRNNTSPFAKHC
jgi:hypothetical protein